MPNDWSQRHLIFSGPAAIPDAVKSLGVEAARALSAEPRYEFQVRRRAMGAAATAEPERAALASTAGLKTISKAPDKAKDKKKNDDTIHRDWSNVMGGASGVGSPGTFPAKFAFGTASANCATDYVAFTTASSGATGSGNFAARAGAISGNPGNNKTIAITNGANTLTLTASNSTNTGLNFLTSGNNTVRATNLANAIARNGGSVGVTASNAGGTTVTISAITQATGGNSISVADGLNNSNINNGNLSSGSGTAGQPTIFALNQLYSSCGSTTQAVPARYWSYTTGTGAVAKTSPVISLNGDQIAFVQSTAGAASLVLLKWSSSPSLGTVGAPTAPTSTTLAAYRACTAPCMTVIAFNGNPDDTNSAPFYDYSNDTLWIGADNGTLHKFTNVFNGTPAEQTTGGFPATISSGNILSSPVYDSVSGLVFIGSARGASFGGQLHTVNSGGTVLSSAQLATNNSTGVSDSPIVDSGAHRVYAFVGSDNTVDCPANSLGYQCAAVYQFPTNVSIGGSVGTKAQVGRGSITANKPLYAGTFDNAYYTSASATPTGFLYVCGATVDASFEYTMWRIPITANVMGTPAIGPTLTTDTGTFAAAKCSPVTQVLNGANEYIFVSIPVTGTETGCSGTGGAAGCIYMYNLTGIAWSAATNTTAGLPAPGGTGGVIIDNTSSTVGASQIYYSTITSPGNAIQASQAALN
ncbi:MAG: hypothetical protein ABI724_01420 [Betaproteobacteria bacterium]